MQLEDALALASAMLLIGFFLGSWWSHRRHEGLRARLAYLERRRIGGRFDIDSEPDSWTIQ